MTVGYQRPAGRFALAAAVLHTAALGVWLGVVLPADIGSGDWSTAAVPSDWERWRLDWETGHAASFGLLLLGFGALAVAVMSERTRSGWEAEPHRPSPESHQELVVAFGTAAQLPSLIPSADQSQLAHRRAVDDPLQLIWSPCWGVLG
jgi:hypothetical protein